MPVISVFTVRKIWASPIHQQYAFFDYTLKEEAILPFLYLHQWSRDRWRNSYAMSKCSSLGCNGVCSISRRLSKNGLREVTGAWTFQIVVRSLLLSQVIYFQECRTRLWHRDVVTFNLENRMKDRDFKGPSPIYRVES